MTTIPHTKSTIKERMMIYVVWSLKALLGLVLFFAIYALCIKFVPYIATGSRDTTGDVSIYLLSNGVHTDFVLPTVNKQKDWTHTFDPAHTQNGHAKDYVAIGWGDKGFYLNTPTWADLKASTALKAVSGFSSSAMHVTFYDQHTLESCEHCAKLSLSHHQYQTLISYIQNDLDTEHGKPIFIATDAVYGKDDAFYEARGSYFLFYTCNTWINQGLKAMGVVAPLWTITDKGILRHYPPLTPNH